MKTWFENYSTLNVQIEKSIKLPQTWKQMWEFERDSDPLRKLLFHSFHSNYAIPR